VRQKGASGSAEVLLRSYVDAQEPGELHRRLLSSFQSGVSSREQKRLHGEASIGASRSEVSRLWRNEGKKLLVKFRERDIQRDDWLVLMLDGVVLERDLVAVVALGITADGTKRLLDFEFGASENAQTSKRLLERLQSRGFSPASGCRLLAVLDGSTALKTAVSAYYPDAVFQRCLVHKERNIRRYLLRREHGELACLFDKLRKAQGIEAGNEAYLDIERFLEKRNASALDSFHEAGDELTALHRLNVPSRLNVSLLSTNLIENSFRNVRRKIDRVTRWRPETEQASCWLAYALGEAEKGFHRLRDSEDLVKLHEALRFPET
jgi:transposase-like protein